MTAHRRPTVVATALLIAALFGLCASVALARPRPMRTVQLRDGTLHTGLYEQLIDGKIRLQSQSTEYVFEADQVEAVYALAPVDSVGSAAQTGDFELGALAGFTVSAGATQYEDAQLRFGLLGGYQLSSYFQVGFESTLATDFREKGATLFDLAATGTFHFGRAPIGYVRAIAGMSLETFGGAMGAGPLFGAAAGVKIPIDRRGAILIGARYTWSQVKLTAERLLLGQAETEVTLQTHSLGVELGWLLYF